MNKKFYMKKAFVDLPPSILTKKASMLHNIHVVEFMRVIAKKEEGLWYSTFEFISAITF